MLSRDLIIRYMTYQPTPEQQFEVVHEYIREKKDVNWNPRQVNLFELQSMFKDAMDHYIKKFHVNILYDKNKKVIKIF